MSRVVIFKAKWVLSVWLINHSLVHLGEKTGISPVFQESSISQTEWLILIQKKGVAQFSLGPEVGKTESPRTATKDDWLKKKKKNQKKEKKTNHKNHCGFGPFRGTKSSACSSGGEKLLSMFFPQSTDIKTLTDIFVFLLHRFLAFITSFVLPPIPSPLCSLGWPVSDVSPWKGSQLSSAPSAKHGLTWSQLSCPQCILPTAGDYLSPGLWSSLWLEGHVLIPPATAATAKSLQSCPTLCDPMDCSLPGFSIHGILQARTLTNTSKAIAPTCWEGGTTQLHGVRGSCTQVPFRPSLMYLFISMIICILYAAAAAAKSLQSCPTLCDSRDGSPPGSPVPGILQARTLEWVAISFSNAWKWKVKVKSLSHVRLFATP